MRFRPSLFVLAAALATSTAFAQTDVPARIAGEALTNGRAVGFLPKAAGQGGRRRTGLKGLRGGSELILGEPKKGGYANRRFEEYPLESRWTRGPASGRIVAPIERPVAVGSYAWVPGTNGETTAPLLDLGAPSSAALPAPLDRFRGAFVLLDPQKAGPDPSFVQRAALAKSLAQAGAAAMLIPSDKPGRMVYTSAFGFYPRGPLPVISVAKEDAALLRRLLAKGPVRLSLDVRNTFDTSPYMERNVIADLPGREANEVVLLGAH